jgi:hypothetical protein
MTFYDFKISDFQSQLDNALSNVHNPDSKLSNLVKNFAAMPNASVEDFNKLVADVQHLDYSSARNKVSAASVVNLLVAQQTHLQQQDIMTKLDATTKSNDEVSVNMQMSFPVKTSDTKVIGCVNNGNAIKPNFTLSKDVAGPVANYEDYLNADAGCKAFAQSSGAHYLSLTGDVSDCKGPFLSASDTYFNCMIDF